MVVVAAVGAGLLSEWAFNKALTATTGDPPVRLPHTMAHLIDMGPGTAYLRQSCPGSGYVACDYVKNYPTHWDDFLFSPDPKFGTYELLDARTKRRIAQEQSSFVKDVLLYDPVGVTRGMALDVLRQISLFRLDLWGYVDTRALYDGRIPEHMYAKLQQRPPSIMNFVVSTTTYLAVLGSIAITWVWWRRRDAAPGVASQPASAELLHSRFRTFSAIVVGGVLLNAALCAVLASSLDRFQARVIWLVPLLALAALAGASKRHRVPRAMATHPAPASPPELIRST